MLKFLDVNTVLLSIGEYPLSYIEFVGTILYFASVWLIARKNMLTWPIGIVSVVLFGILFYQIQLYSDTIEQVYYLGVSAYGWVTWSRDRVAAQEIRAEFSRFPRLLGWLGLTVAASIGMALAVARFHVWFPGWFPVAASYPFRDALTTVMSFVAMFLMARRRTESWVYWIVVDIIGIGLYWVKDVKFISLQYVVLLGMATYGLIHWLREERQRSDDKAGGEPSTAGDPQAEE